MEFTKREYQQFYHGISMSLLSKKSAQKWRYDDETAEEIRFLEGLESKVLDKIRQADTPQTETKIETQNSNLTFEKDECAKEYEELGLKELKELIKADRKTELTISKMEQVDKDINVRSKDEPQTYVINPQEPTNDDKCFECDDFFTCGGQCNKIETEPQTCSVNGRPYSECGNCEYHKCTADEPQTERSSE